MELLKSKVDKIATAMKKIEDVANSEINNQEEYLQVCGAMLAVTRNMYVDALGVLLALPFVDFAPPVAVVVAFDPFEA